jgi:hypothetical protein
MWTQIIIGVVCYILGVVSIGVILFAKMARKNAVMEKRIMEIASGVAHNVALNKTIYGDQLAQPDVNQQFRRTRKMVAHGMGLETDDQILDGADLDGGR